MRTTEEENMDYVYNYNDMQFFIETKNNIEENKHLKAVKGKEYKNNVDIVLPIILPETMRNKGDMMGWILGCFKEIVDELSKVEA